LNVYNFFFSACLFFLAAYGKTLLYALFEGTNQLALGLTTFTIIMIVNMSLGHTVIIRDENIFISNAIHFFYPGIIIMGIRETENVLYGTVDT